MRRVYVGVFMSRNINAKNADRFTILVTISFMPRIENGAEIKVYSALQRKLRSESMKSECD
jgi:hypothetical protein